MMKCLIADDEPLILKDIHRTAKKVLGEDVEYFLAENSDEAVAIADSEHLTGYDIQIAFLDIEMPFISGLEVAKKIQKISSRTNIIFVTGHGKYALDVLEMYVSGFIMKPVNEKSMRKAIENLRYPIQKLFVKCFGYFDIFFGDVPIDFKRTQSREITAYLIDKNGSYVSEDELRYLLWSEDDDTEKKRRYIRNIISDIRNAFKSYGVEDIIINNNKSFYCINKDKISCDYFDYLDGKIDISDEEKESYMEQYPWAEL